jgi:hypothetical protein
MTACPSRLELSRWEAEPARERPAALAEHVGTCGRCAAVFADIASARGFLLGDDPAAASARAARQITALAADRRPSRRWLRFLWPAMLVPAAALVLLAVRPSLLTRGGDGRGAVSVKGGLVIETYCKRGDQVFPASDGQDFLAGDRLRFAYTTARAGYLVLFGVDDRGTVFPYYPEGALIGFHAEGGARVLLPDSVELDAHQGWERIYALWSDAQLGDAAIRSAVAAALAASGNDIRRATVLDLPAEQMSMLLRRP